MFPLGILSQGSKLGGIRFINFNGSYQETNEPTTPTWTDGTERQLLFETNNSASQNVLSMPAVELWKGVYFNLLFPDTEDLSEYALHVNSQPLTTDRIHRRLQLASASPYYNINLPEGTQYKIHAFSTNNVFGGFRLILLNNALSGYLETIQTSNTNGATFSLSPYDGGTGWFSSAVHTAHERGIILTIGRNGGTSVINAIAVEII